MTLHFKTHFHTFTFQDSFTWPWPLTWAWLSAFSLRPITTWTFQAIFYILNDPFTNLKEDFLHTEMFGLILTWTLTHTYTLAFLTALGSAYFDTWSWRCSFQCAGCRQLPMLPSMLCKRHILGILTQQMALNFRPVNAILHWFRGWTNTWIPKVHHNLPKLFNFTYSWTHNSSMLGNTLPWAQHSHIIMRYLLSLLILVGRLSNLLLCSAIHGRIQTLYLCVDILLP
jgi:hypothetical protein